MLNYFRRFTASLGTKILLCLLILSFMVWGIEDMVRTGSRNATVITVGDTKISASEFAGYLEGEQRSLRAMLGENYSPEIAKQFNIESRVLQRLVNQSLLAQESKALGLIPSDADVARAIHANPAFHNEKGTLDKAKFTAALRNKGISEKAFVDDLRRKISSGLLLEAVSSVPVIPQNAAETLLAAREEQRAVTLYSLSPSLLPAAEKPSDDELDSYYKERARNYTSPEYRTVSYVTITQNDAKKAAAVSADDLKKAYQERIDEFKMPEQRVIEQLLFGNEDAAKKAYGELASGKPFEQVAKESNILNKSSLALGTLTQNNVQVAGEEIFSISKGSFTEPVKSGFGWHIFRVRDILPASTKPLESVRAALEKDLAQQQADQALNNLTNNLEDKIAGGGTLKEAAADLGLKLVTLPAVDKNGKLADGSAAKGLPTHDKFLETAFKTDEKSESGLIASKGGVYYIVRTESITPERVRPLAEVKTTLVNNWQQEAQRKKLAELSKTIEKSFAEQATRSAAINQYRLSGSAATIKRASDAGKLPGGLVEDIFAHAPGSATGAFEGKNGEFVIAVVQSVIPAPAPAKDAKYKETLAAINKGLDTQMQDEVLTQYMRYLATKYPVSVNEAALKSMTAPEQ